jgi:hypothetical protein
VENTVKFQIQGMQREFGKLQIHKNQSGIRSSHSCHTTLSKLVDELQKETQEITHVMFLDLKKHLT